MNSKSRSEIRSDAIGSEYTKSLLFVCHEEGGKRLEIEIPEVDFEKSLTDSDHLDDLVDIEGMSINLKDKISEVSICTHKLERSVNGERALYHAFVVFKTTNDITKDYYWWSLEKNTKYVVLQRSRNESDVKDYLKTVDESGKRKTVVVIGESTKGIAILKEVLTLLANEIGKKYILGIHDCQDLASKAYEVITGKEWKSLVQRFVRKFPFLRPHKETAQSQSENPIQW